jgi:hypothetical protein
MWFCATSQFLGPIMNEYFGHVVILRGSIACDPQSLTFEECLYFSIVVVVGRGFICGWRGCSTLRQFSVPIGGSRLHAYEIRRTGISLVSAYCKLVQLHTLGKIYVATGMHL